MSKIKLNLGYPAYTDEYYWENPIDKTPECIAAWELNRTSFIANRLNTDLDGTYVKMEFGDELVLPFLSGDLSKISTQKFNLRYKQVDANFSGFLTIETAPGVQYQFTVLNNSFSTYEFIDLSYCQYIKIIHDFEFETSNFNIYIDSDFLIETSEYETNTEENEVSINMNLKTSLTVANTISTRKTKQTEVYYSDDIIITNEQMLEMNELVDLARLNRLLVHADVNTNERAGDSMAGINSGGAQNWMRYYYKRHSTGQKTGLYSYVNISYFRDNNVNSYI
jgi:hypothetical protein